MKQGDDPDARRQAYAADVTYVTNKELTFDYLKDRIATSASRGDARHKVASLFGDTRGGLLLRGLHVAIVDEADSVLIDEARTPLIISAERRTEGLAEMAERALDIARELATARALPPGCCGPHAGAVAFRARTDCRAQRGFLRAVPRTPCTRATGDAGTDRAAARWSAIGITS